MSNTQENISEPQLPSTHRSLEASKNLLTGIQVRSTIRSHLQFVQEKMDDLWQLLEDSQQLYLRCHPVVDPDIPDYLQESSETVYRASHAVANYMSKLDKSLDKADKECLDHLK